MRILFDQGTPVPLRSALTAHQVATAFEMGWSTLENGDLLRRAEGQFDVFITTDQNLRYQQNLAGRRLAILVLPTTNWMQIREHLTSKVQLCRPFRAREFWRRFSQGAARKLALPWAIFIRALTL